MRSPGERRRRSFDRKARRNNWLARHVAAQAGICAICNEAFGPHGDDVATLDHVWPLGRHGHNTFGNTQAAHARCNNGKGARLPREMIPPSPASLRALAAKFAPAP